MLIIFFSGAHTTENSGKHPMIGKNVFEHGFSLNEKNELVDNDGVHLATK